MMDYVMDFTGYYVPKKKYMIKEFCLIPISCKKPLKPKSDVVNPPYAWSKLPAAYQKQYTKRFNKKYGIDYSLGGCTVNDAFNAIVEILKQARVIYLKNDSRKQFLTQFTGIPFNNVVSLELQGYNSGQKMSPALCSNHASKKNCCVVKDALSMAEWLVQMSFASKDSNCQPLLNLEVLEETEFKDDDEVESKDSQRGSEISDGQFEALSSKIDRYRAIHAKLLKELEDLKNDSDYDSSSDLDDDLFDKVSDALSFVSDAISLARSQDCNELIESEERELDQIDNRTAGLESTQKDCEGLKFDFDKGSFDQTESMKIPSNSYEPSNYSFPDGDNLSRNSAGDEDGDNESYDSDDDDGDDNNGFEDELFVADSESGTSDFNSEQVIMETDEDESDIGDLESEVGDFDSEPVIVESDEDESDIADLGLRTSDSNSQSVISGPESVDTFPFTDFGRKSRIGSEDSDLATEMSLNSSNHPKLRFLEDKSVIGSSEGYSDRFDKESAFDDSSESTENSHPMKRFKAY